MSLSLHGENGITYAIFNDLEKSHKVKEFLTSVKLLDNKRINVDEAKRVDIHLFPSFGRGGKVSGFGEPDAIILSDKFYMMLEVETKPFLKAMPSNVKEGDIVHRKENNTNRGITYQLERFYSIGKLLSEKYCEKEIELGKRIKGNFVISNFKKRELEVSRKNVELIKQMVRLKNKYYIVCLTADKELPSEYQEYISKANIFLKKKSKDPMDEGMFGWIGYGKVEEFAKYHNLKLTLDTLKLNDLMQCAKC